MGLFATRTSCQHFQGKQLRALALAGTVLASAQVDTLRIKLLKGSPECSMQCTA